jgi:asparagine synthetase A
MALKQFDCRPGEGICTDMRAVRKDYFLDHDHSAYVDQWDWERVITAEQRNLEFLKSVVRKIWKVLVGAEKFAQNMFPDLRKTPYPNLPEELTFIHAEELLAMYPDLPRKRRETEILQKYPGVFIIASAGLFWMAFRMRCAPQTTTTGLPTPARKLCATLTDSTATSWSGITSPSAVTNSVRWASE